MSYTYKTLLPLLCTAALSAHAESVIFSQYIEGSGNNKAVELYNPTAQPVDLSDYQIAVYSNGNTSASVTLSLAGTLDAGQTYVVAQSTADAAILAVANQTTGASLFNGDDAIVLSYSGGIVDRIGQRGVDPGSQWGSGLISTQDNTLVRKANIGQGDNAADAPFDPSIEWDGFAQDDFSGLGSHTFNGGSDDTPVSGIPAGVCTNCPELAKVADAATFDPVAYYAVVQTEIDAASAASVIRERLSETIASGQRVLTYTQVWSALTATDEDPQNSTNIRLFYSNRSIPKSENGSGSDSTNDDFWNREHSWPRSHGFNDSGFEAHNDIHHLRATDISVNRSRGNLDFDNSDNALAEAPLNKIDGDSFEPRDDIKGDVARMMLYMDVRYEGSGSDATPDLVLVDAITSTGEARLGKLCTLLAWHDADPVDSTEQARHSAIYEYQGNRNPFIDHPEWVSLLYSADSCGDNSGDPSDPTDPTDPTDPNEPVVGELAGAMVLSGVIDGPLSGGTPKAIEVFVTRAIDDLSRCGLGSANNGNGGGAQEFTFDAVSAEAGEFIYVASENSQFDTFLGFAPDYTSGAASINGDDAIELFCDGEVVDTFGDINTDGTGEAWEYLDGWAYRVAQTQPDGSFTLAHWTFSGKNALDGESSNASAATPFPIGTYTSAPVELFFSEYVEGGSNNKAVEIVNTGSTAIDLADYDVQIFFNGSNSAGQTIGLSGSLAAGDVYVLANSGSVTAIKDVADQLSGSLLFNGDDAVALRNAGEIIDVIGQIGVDPGSQWGSDLTSTQDNTLRRLASITQGDSDGSDAFDPALEWEGFAKDTFDGLGFYASNDDDDDDTPVDPIGACGDDATFISAVQGSADQSAMAGQTVVVEAVVTAVTPELDGFFLQEEDADNDADAATSEGLFVYSASLANQVVVGDVVRVKGAIAEQFGKTQMVGDELVICGSASVTPASITLPLANASDLEAYESMLVTNANDWVITDLYRYMRYGEAVVSSERLFIPTQKALPGSSEAQAIVTANSLNRLILDDLADGAAQNLLMPAGGPTPTNPLRTGTEVSNVAGILDYGFSNYRLRLLSTPTLIDTNPREAAPVVADGNLTIASFNVYNLFNGDGAGNGFPTSRGADTVAEYERQLSKLVKAMVAMEADVLGLMELENDGAGVNSSVAQLTAAINAEFGANVYDYVAVPETIGTDAITNGIIYRTDVMAPQGAPEFLTSANSISDEQGPLFNTSKNRPSVAQSFVHTATGQTVVLNINHLKSKGSSCGAGDDDTTNGQGNCNLTRTRAAQALTQWLEDTFAGQAVLVMGDMNAYAKEEPMQAFEAAGWVNLATTLHGPDAYSYSFSGEVGSLDHVMANAAMLEWAIDATEWHINADELVAFDFNDEFYFGPDKPTDLLNTLMYRASDHDPVVVTFDLPLAPVRGDFDGDRDVDQNDIRGLIVAIARRMDIDMAFDLDGDGRITTRDARVMRTLCTRAHCATR